MSNQYNAEFYKEIIKYAKWVGESRRDPYKEYMVQWRNWSKDCAGEQDRV